MAEHGPHCETCTCGCTCGYGGQHEPDKETCELNQDDRREELERAVLDVARLTVDSNPGGWALIPLARAVDALRAATPKDGER